MSRDQCVLLDKSRRGCVYLVVLRFCLCVKGSLYILLFIYLMFVACIFALYINNFFLINE